MYAFLDSIFTDGIKVHQNKSFINALKSGRDKLRKYYDQQSIVETIATVLNPRNNISYFTFLDW
ncbi:hypothetical protein HK096_001357, partial [Nowakowskiella sp. JEL0078]